MDSMTTKEFLDYKAKKPTLGKPKKNFKESDLQQSCIKAFRLLYPELCLLLISIPNGVHAGGKTIRRKGRDIPISAIVAKAEGRVKGASDLFLFVARKEANGLCLECKTESGTLSKEQRSWSKAVWEQGYRYEVFKSIDDFLGILKDYLS